MLGEDFKALVGPSHSVVVSDAASTDPITIPEQVLFNAQFKRVGDDLKLISANGDSLDISGDFKAEKLPALLSPAGGQLTGDVVAALAGPANPGQYAAIAVTQPNAAAIGYVVKVDGHATVVRNGVALALNAGDALLKGDVVQTDSGGSLGMAFNDGSAFQISSDSRLVLSDYSYDPNGTANSEVFNLVQGTFSFVAGQIAKTGHMAVGTPAATMQIEGTAGGGAVSALNGQVKLYIFRAIPLPKALLSNHDGNLIATLTGDNDVFVLTPMGPTQYGIDSQNKTDADKISISMRSTISCRSSNSAMSSSPACIPKICKPPPTTPARHIFRRA